MGYASFIGERCMFEDLEACYEMGDTFKVLFRQQINWHQDVAIVFSDQLPHGWNGHIENLTIGVDPKYRNVMYQKEGKFTRVNVNFDGWAI